MKSKFVVGVDASNIRGGGGLRHLTELLTNAEPERHSIFKVIVWAHPDAMTYYPSRSWLEVICVKWFAKSLFHRYLWRHIFMKRELEKHCDVMFVPGGISLSVGIPDVVVSQNMQPFLKEERRAVGFGGARLRLECLRLLQGRSFQNAKGRVFLTNYAKNTIRRQFWFSSHCTSVIPHGIDPVFFVNPRDKLSQLESNPCRIVYVSTLNYYKHQVEVIKAVDAISAKYPDVSLKLVGAANPRYQKAVSNALVSVNKKHGSELISYVGKAEFNELLSIYKETDIFVFASSCENLPNILLEAMASCLPIACSTSPPMPDVLGAAGAYFDPTCPESIAKAIEIYILSMEERVNAAQKAYALANRYSWQSTASKTFDLLAQVAVNRNGLSEGLK